MKIALVAMTLDHANKYLFDENLPGLFELGRIAMPLFGFVLAYNLARPGTLENGAYQRTLKRLALYGVAATPFFIGLGHLAYGWWPLNIMFMLAVAAATMFLAEKGGTAGILGAIVVFLIGGAFVEFWWPALAFCLAAWWYCKTTSKAALVLWIVAAGSLYVINRNLWAMAAIPLILSAPLVQLQLPRCHRLFYRYYPVHLAVLLLVATTLKLH